VTFPNPMDAVVERNRGELVFLDLVDHYPRPQTPQIITRERTRPTSSPAFSWSNSECPWSSKSSNFGMVGEGIDDLTRGKCGSRGREHDAPMGGMPNQLDDGGRRGGRGRAGLPQSYFLFSAPPSNVVTIACI
jgi:hypothetical protein